MKICTINPGDTVRVAGFKKPFVVISIYYSLIEVEIGLFVEQNTCRKKYKNKYLTLPHE